jgi:hypothetical protein
LESRVASEPAKLRLTVSALIKTKIEIPSSHPARVARLPLVREGKDTRDAHHDVGETTVKDKSS